MDEYKKVAIEAATEAGKLILELRNNLSFEMKSTYDVLAEGDKKSEELIKSKIKQNFPGHSILAEESGEETDSAEFLWVIDPIDGTINYVKGLDDFCVSIALEHKGELVLGVLYLPVTGKLCIAEKGNGAFVNDERLYVSTENQAINSILSTENSSHIETRKIVFETLARVYDKIRGTRINGSSEISLLRVAQGKFDMFYKPMFNYWDVAAGVVFIREAGGRVTDRHGEEFNRKSDGIIATNGLIHSQALELFTS